MDTIGIQEMEDYQMDMLDMAGDDYGDWVELMEDEERAETYDKMLNECVYITG